MEDKIEPITATANHAAGGPSPAIEMEGIDVEESPRVRTKVRVAAILIALYLCVFIAALDQTIMATAIPTIAAALHSASGYAWIGGAYLLANAAAGPIWAKCSDIWGRKPAVLLAVALFAGASILAARSASMRMLIAARALQGTAGGGLILLANITISDLFSMRDRTLYLGFMEVMWGIAGGAGPLIGGALTEFASWQWCFWINLPVCGITFVLLVIFLDVHNPRTKLRDGMKAVDWLGTASILAVTLMLLLGLDFGGAIFPWSSPKVICLIVFGTLMIGVFWICEDRWAKYPLMPLALFKDRSNIAALTLGFAQGMVFIAAEYYLPLYFQSVMQASPLNSGVRILPITLSQAITGIAVGILIHQTGRYRELIWVGTALMTLGTGLYIHFDRTTSIAAIVVFELIGGCGCGLLFEAPLIAIQNTVRQADTATATATFSFTRNLATSTSIVLGGVVFQNSMAARAPALRAAGLDDFLVETFAGPDAAAHVALIAALPDAAHRAAVQDAFARSLRNLWILYCGIAAGGMVAGGFVRQTHLSGEHTETKTGLQELGERVG